MKQLDEELWGKYDLSSSTLRRCINLPNLCSWGTLEAKPIGIQNYWIQIYWWVLWILLSKKQESSSKVLIYEPR